MPRFAVLMREDDEAWGRLPDAEQSRLLGLYGAWVGELRTRGAFLDGWPLGGPGRILSASPDGVVDRPFDGTKQVLTGLFVVEAADLAAAVELARGCPALLHGETVEVRPIGH